MQKKSLPRSPRPSVRLLVVIQAAAEQVLRLVNCAPVHVKSQLCRGGGKSTPDSTVCGGKKCSRLLQHVVPRPLLQARTKLLRHSLGAPSYVSYSSNWRKATQVSVCGRKSGPNARLMLLYLLQLASVLALAMGALQWSGVSLGFRIV